MITLTTPLSEESITQLRAGDFVFLSGTIYTARDQAHKRMLDAIRARKSLPFDPKGQIIYYCGPTATPKRKVIGACGPTTSSRMDAFTPALLKAGVRAMIGKGARNRETIEAIKKYKAVYLLAYAGCGALMSEYVKSKKLIAYKDLGPEAINELQVRDFPCYVGIDCRGKVISRAYNLRG
jgi:fumarate hydratase subunit beta